MKISEKILLFFSRKPGSQDCQFAKEDWNPDNALCLLSRVFPDFMDMIAGKEILDFGCGAGYQSIALAKNGAKYVLGIEIDQSAIKHSSDLARKFSLEEKVEFKDNLEEHLKGRFDMVISQNSMEHFEEPLKILNLMKSALNQYGILIITFGNPWFSPYGSHTDFFTQMPWVNIIFSEKTVMNVRGSFRNDGAAKYAEVKSGLNKMTVKKFEQIIMNCNMKIQYKRYDCVKGINLLSKIPLIRELFINNISCILCKE